jgi:transposase
VRSATILPNPSCLKLLGLSADTNTSTATEMTIATRASCPVCQRTSAHVHSRYTRRLAALHLVLHGRKFVCDNPTSERQIFTECLPSVVAAYARQTRRQEEWVIAIGFALGCETGARLLRALGLGMSAVGADQLLARIRRCAVVVPPPARVLSVDDFARRFRSTISRCGALSVMRLGDAAH